MIHSIYISTTEPGSGKALIALGIIEALLKKTTKISFFRPLIRNNPQEEQNQDIQFITTYFNLKQDYSESFGLSYQQANQLISKNKTNTILEIIISKYKALEQKSDFIVCEGSDYLGSNSAFEFNLNQEIAKTLGCPILILGNADNKTIEEALSPVQIARQTYLEKQEQIIGIILNKVNPAQLEAFKTALVQEYGEFNYLLSAIPYEQKLNSPRISEVIAQLQAETLYGEKRLDSLVSYYLVAAMQIQHALQRLKEDALVITPGDRADIIIGMIQADQSAKYPKLSGILLTSDLKPEPAIALLIEGLENPPPVLSVKTDTYHSVSQIAQLYTTTGASDLEKIALFLKLFDDHVDLPKLEQLLNQVEVVGITPKMFTYNLLQQAKSQKRHIVLPEGNEPRILKAATVLQAQDVVDLTLLGKKAEIEETINKHGIQLDINQLKIINPSDSDKLEHYAETLYELRKNKGITLEAAHDYVMDISYFGTMMVYLQEADGMVSGSIHTTEHTIRPALQIIKTKPGFSLVSSVFLMCLEDRVLVYGDCAVNPNPTAAQLAEIAITSADTAVTFGIDPKVALLSYSSGASGKGEEVEKVREAVKIAQQRRPDLKLEGPIQYDAAVDMEVAAQKMPGSQVAGQATVFVFPDLNTGNNTYKAVQRETGAIAIGPILQGLKKPVNDLSRGCTVEDIINTVIITAIQAQN